MRVHQCTFRDLVTWNVLLILCFSNLQYSKGPRFKAELLSPSPLPGEKLHCSLMTMDAKIWDTHSSTHQPVVLWSALSRSSASSLWPVPSADPSRQAMNSFRACLPFLGNVSRR